MPVSALNLDTQCSKHACATDRPAESPIHTIIGAAAALLRFEREDLPFVLVLSAQPRDIEVRSNRACKSISLDRVIFSGQKF
jgi:hypothetical protein